MRINTIFPFNDYELKGTYLVLISPDKIPHLILVHQKKYYSLTYKKSVIAEDFLPYLNVLIKKKYPLLLVELKQNDFNIEEEFRKYQHVDTQNITCLKPIKNAILQNSEADFVFELIPELERQMMVLNYAQINLNGFLNADGSFTLKKYSKSDIFKHIESLNLKHVES